MHTSHQHHPEPTEGWREVGVTADEWQGLHNLLELVRAEHKRNELTPERRDQIRDRLFQRLDKLERRRRRVRVFLTGASALLLAALTVKLVAHARA
jgi:hypothetical protein